MERIPGFYYRYLGSRMLASIASNTFYIYFMWIIVQRYQSVFLAGLLATISVTVNLISSIPIGHLIDRVNSTVVGLISSVICLVGALFLLINESLTIIYIVTALIGVGTTMKGDAFVATIKKHLSEGQFANANANNQAVFFASTLTGTALGGVSILYLSHYFAYLLVLLLVASVISSAPIREQITRTAGSKAITELASVMRFYKKIIGFLVAAFVLNGLFVSLDVYASGLFHLVLKVSSIYYTIFVASISVGGIAGSGIANLLKERINSGYFLALLSFTYAPLILFLGISRDPILDIVDAFTIGVLLSVINIPLQTKLMKIVPHNIFGKVMAFLRIFVGGATPAMAAVLSFLALYFRVDEILIFVGIALFPVASLDFIVLPRFMKMISSNEDASETPA